MDQAANRAILALVSGWLAIAPERLRLLRGSRSAAKVLEVDGISDSEIAQQLKQVARSNLLPE